MRHLAEGETWEGLLEGRIRRFVISRISTDGIHMQVHFAEPFSEETLSTAYFLHCGQWQRVEPQT